MENYKKIIDSVMDELYREKNGSNKDLTKILNYEFLFGKLYGVYAIAEEVLPGPTFYDLYSYRQAEKDMFSIYFNTQYINPLYRREAIG